MQIEEMTRSGKMFWCLFLFSKLVLQEKYGNSQNMHTDFVILKV